MKTPIERFWAKVIETETCWLWVGTKFQSGYGRVKWNGKHRRVHRVAYELMVGPIPEGLLICHKCDVRNCVRPDHLFPGTQKDNIDDMISKGRANYLTGENHPLAKLRAKEVNQIIELVDRGVTQRKIAQQFAISQQEVSHIIIGRRWGWTPPIA